MSEWLNAAGLPIPPRLFSILLDMVVRDTLNCCLGGLGLDAWEIYKCCFLLMIPFWGHRFGDEIWLEADVKQNIQFF